MSFASPDDTDDEQPTETDETDPAETDADAPDDGVESTEIEETEVEADSEEGELPDAGADGETPEDPVYLEWAEGWGVHPEGELPLREAVEENARIIFTFIQDLQREVRELEEEVGELREEKEQLQERIKSLESWKGSMVSSTNQNIGDINRLYAAVFGEETPCNECGDGSLQADVGGFGTDTISCDTCDYEEELA